MSNLVLVSQLKKKISTILASKQNNNLKQFILKSVAGTFGMSVASAALGYMITLLLARFLGAKGYGAYTFALTLIGLIKLPTLLGLNTLIIRELSISQTNQSWNLSSGLLRWSNRVIIISSAILALAAVYLSWRFPQLIPSDALPVFWIGILSLPLIALGHIRQAAMQAFGHIIKAQLPIV
ncbi:MAG: oligosaccharide flippase family protein, partial [Cyanobacteria bacterium J06558_2]